MRVIIIVVEMKTFIISDYVHKSPTYTIGSLSERKDVVTV